MVNLNHWWFQEVHTKKMRLQILEWMGYNLRDDPNYEIPINRFFLKTIFQCWYCSYRDQSAAQEGWRKRCPRRPGYEFRADRPKAAVRGWTCSRVRPAERPGCKAELSCPTRGRRAVPTTDGQKAARGWTGWEQGRRLRGLWRWMSRGHVSVVEEP